MGSTEHQVKMGLETGEEEGGSRREKRKEGAGGSRGRSPVAV
jgi:hypothetical protein